MAINLTDWTITARMQWDASVRKRLALATAKELSNLGKAETFDVREMMSAFRKVMPTVLEPKFRRYIGGPSRVTWLEQLIRNELDSAAATNPQVNLVTKSKEENQNSIIAEQSELILAQSVLIQELITKVEGLCRAVGQLNRSEPPASPQTVPVKLRIVIIGLSKGQQQTEIDRYTSIRYPQTKLIAFNFAQNDIKLPLYDHVIVMNWVIREGAQRLRNVFGNDFKTAHGLKEVKTIIDSLS